MGRALRGNKDVAECQAPRYHAAVSKLGAPLTDTSPDVEKRQLELFRNAPPWRKLELMDQLNQSVRLLALIGLRQRFPGATEAKLDSSWPD